MALGTLLGVNNGVYNGVYTKQQIHQDVIAAFTLSLVSHQCREGQNYNDYSVNSTSFTSDMKCIIISVTYHNQWPWVASLFVYALQRCCLLGFEPAGLGLA